MAADLFDMRARALRRDRAARTGPVLFLYERAFDDARERLALVNRRFASALLIGAPDPSWPVRLGQHAEQVTAVAEGSLDVEPHSFDLVVVIGALDTNNALPDALLSMRFALKPDSLLIGAISGGDTLPRLREAMRAADAVANVASPHVHPRIEPAALAQLLTAAGFTMPVIDVDRVPVAYRSFRRLVADLRGMGATNILNARSRTPLSRRALSAAERDFEAGGERTTELFEILHFAAWTPPA